MKKCTKIVDLPFYTVKSCGFELKKLNKVNRGFNQNKVFALKIQNHLKIYVTFRLNFNVKSSSISNFNHFITHKVLKLLYFLFKNLKINSFSIEIFTKLIRFLLKISNLNHFITHKVLKLLYFFIQKSQN